MSTSEYMSLGDVKNRLSEVVDRLEREHGRVVITKHGRPAAVVLSVEDLEALEETLDVMTSRNLLADIREALDEREKGTAVLSKEDALRLDPSGKLHRRRGGCSRVCTLRAAGTIGSSTAAITRPGAWTSWRSSTGQAPGEANFHDPQSCTIDGDLRGHDLRQCP